MSLHNTLERFGTEAATKVQDLWRRWQDGDLTETEFRTLARAVLIRAGARSTALADIALATALSTAPTGLEVPPQAADAAGDAVAETLASESYQRDPVAAVAVLGSAYAYAQFQESYGQGMRAQGVTHWERVPNPGACEVCTDLAEGVVSADIPMWHHKGCRCVPRPTGERP